MENKINIAELLKDCPKGMELDCALYDNVFFDGIDTNDDNFPISLYYKHNNIKNGFSVTKYGTYNNHQNTKCIIFPKGKTTWEGFQRPFKDGDIVAYDCTDGGTQLYIFKEQNEVNSCCTCYLMLDCYGELDLDKGRYYITRFATEEEKQKLFDTIKAKGYKWNTETKTLEKIIVPKFKVGDKIIKKDTPTECWYVQGVDTDRNSDYFYCIVAKGKIANLHFKDQNEWELVPNKFDISTLKAYDKVLVRDTDEQVWVADLFSHVLDRPLGGYTFACVGHYPNQCIPFLGNEHLLGTTNDCDNYYKTW